MASAVPRRGSNAPSERCPGNCAIERTRPCAFARARPYTPGSLSLPDEVAPLPQLPPDEPSHRSVLAILGQKTGLAPKILLPDSGSEHGASPVVTPGSPASKLVPQGRGNYQLLGEIARGGMGVILKGHDTDLGRDVAVKVLDPSSPGVPKSSSVLSRRRRSADSSSTRASSRCTSSA